MNAEEFLVKDIAVGRRYVDGALSDMTEEQFNWAPPGTANRISATVLHLAYVEDNYVHAVLQSTPRLWETWAERFCVSVPPVREGWAEANSKQIEMAPVLAYLQAVRVDTDAYMAGISAEVLDRQFEVRGAQRTGADLLATIAVHPALHAGEIAALKGIQGVKGLPI